MLNRLKKKKSPKEIKKVDPIRYLIEFPGLWRMNENQRHDMTVACRDTDYIKKVKGSGKVLAKDGIKVQLMHNGLMMKLGGYHGEWMAKIISDLKGHHEPQEEKVFYEVLRRLGSNSTMIELGAFWAYYSIWFNYYLKKATNICCEPDPNNLAIGKLNAQINKVNNIHFIEGAAGKTDGEMTDVVMDSSPKNTVRVPIRTASSLAKEYGMIKVDLLHMDVQGFELGALEGAQDLISSKKLRFIFVSTHHYFFSGKANTHQECLHFIKKNGGHIISSHTVAESFSGDGLIVASFDDRDKNFKVETSINHTDQSLFRSYEEDVALLADLYRRNSKEES